MLSGIRTLRRAQASSSGATAGATPDLLASSGADSGSYAFNTRSRTARTAEALSAEAAAAVAGGGAAAGLPAAPRAASASGLSNLAAGVRPAHSPAQGQGERPASDGGAEAAAAVAAAASSTLGAATTSGDAPAAAESTSGVGVDGSGRSVTGGNGRPPLAPTPSVSSAAAGAAAAAATAGSAGAQARDSSRRPSGGGDAGPVRVQPDSEVELRKAYADMKKVRPNIGGTRGL